jgi:hypothetical protein
MSRHTHPVLEHGQSHRPEHLLLCKYGLVADLEQSQTARLLVRLLRVVAAVVTLKHFIFCPALQTRFHIVSRLAALP